MKNAFSLLCFLMLFSCANRSVCDDAAPLPPDSTENETNVVDKACDTLLSPPNGKSLNDIRFGNWDRDDWHDNDYFRTFRAHLDDWLCGKVGPYEELEQYKQEIAGSKFGVVDMAPFIIGGLLFDVVFVEAPHIVIRVCVYSRVDVENETVTDYEVRSMELVRYDPPFTKEEILTIVKEHPENKLW